MFLCIFTFFDNFKVKSKACHVGRSEVLRDLGRIGRQWVKQWGILGGILGNPGGSVGQCVMHMCIYIYNYIYTIVYHSILFSHS